MNWIKTSDRLPEKPGLRSYEQIDCLIYIKGNIKRSAWNCEHLCWDDEHGDDFMFSAGEPSHWCQVLPPLPDVEATAPTPKE